MRQTSKNGQLFICKSCQKIHLEFGNIGLDFKSDKSLKELSNYLKTVSKSQFKKENVAANYRRSILIPFPNTTVKALLSDVELEEIITLIGTFLKKRDEQPMLNPEFADLKAVSYLREIILN